MVNFLKKQNVESDNSVKETVKAMLLDDNPEGLIAADENGNIIYANRLGSAIMEIGIFGPIDIVSKNTKQFIYQNRTYEAKYAKIPESTGIKGTVAYLVDVIGKSKQAEEIEELKKNLEHANAFKDAFLANMSHEIRTPIHAIIGFAEIIKKQELADEISGQIDMIKEASYSLLAIINDVLDLSKIESGKLELVCSNYYISYIIRDIESTFSLLAYKKGIKFEMHLDENIPSYIYGDKIRMRGVLLNILNNAIKFTKEGRVDFYINVLEKKNGIVTLQFVVKDTGIGIKREDQDRIFESFSKFDINNNYAVEGRGLGLSIAKGYVNLMGGSIDVKSKYGVGSTFTVTINQKIIDDSPIDMKIVNARKRESEKFTIKDCRVLVVDDNPVNLKVAGGLMNTYNLDVEKASGGKEAINLCMNNRYDIIFMDQMMPEVDGIMAMHEIRKISDFYKDECKIIVLTADAMAGVRDRLLKDGFDEYLCKPLEIHRLESVLKEIVPESKFEYDTPEIIDVAPDFEVKAPNAIPKADKEEDIAEEKSELRLEDNISLLADNLEIPIDVLKRKIKDCGGELSDYKSLCSIAYRHYEERIEKLRESQSVKDYERYIINVHSLKSSVASLGAMDLAAEARNQENAGKEGNFALIDNGMEKLIDSYTAFMQKIGQYVLEVFEDKKEEIDESVEEWSREDISKVCKRITALVEEYNFGAIFDLLEDVMGMEMGKNTKEIFKSFVDIMNDMDIDKLKEKLGEYN